MIARGCVSCRGLTHNKMFQRGGLPSDRSIEAVFKRERPSVWWAGASDGWPEWFAGGRGSAPSVFAYRSFSEG